MTYPIENEYYKNQISLSNRYMVDDSDVIICYVDFNRYLSGAKKAVKYAEKQGKEIIQLFRIEDKISDAEFENILEQMRNARKKM